jgi:hypothetical protein
MASGAKVQQLYASSETVDSAAVEDGRPPATLALFDAAHASQLDDEYHMAYIGMLHPRDLRSGLVRQAGAMLDGGIGIYQDLQGELDMDGLEYVEVVIAIAAQDPRALGTRYLS